MKQVILSGIVLWLMAGCAGVQTAAIAPPVEGVNASGQIRPLARPTALNTTARRPPEAARTVEEFDTTTAAEKQAAAAPATAGAAALGDTVASLGDPSEPGFWMKTPLVSAPAKGRVSYATTGKSVQVDLIPLDGPKTAGSQMSLAALRVLEAPLAGLPVVQVFKE